MGSTLVRSCSLRSVTSYSSMKSSEKDTTRRPRRQHVGVFRSTCRQVVILLTQGSRGMDVVKNSSRMRGVKVAFKTKSEVEIMDDGYKWRKYGKKMVKDSPNPRNYYRCLKEGCIVKKRVEREREDSSYVITT